MPAPSPRAAHLAALFGISPAAPPPAPPCPAGLPICPGDLVLLTGPSGAGKSTLLRALAGRLAADHPRLTLHHLAADPLPADRPAIDCLPGPLAVALAHAARAGLAEARLLLTPPARLSDGEQFRFRLARFFATDADVLIADECCAALDRVTAKAVAWNLARHLRAAAPRPRTALLATAHDDLAPDLHPTLHVRLTLVGPWSVERIKQPNIRTPISKTPR
jgi:predicted ABC-type transport system involved in lysophospholipase L1 biosynthesis ATPase subunit